MSERQILVPSARSFLRRLLLSLSAALLLGGLQAASAELITKPASADSSLRLVGRYFVGATRTVEVAGDLVYFGSGFYLIEANVSDPAHPVIRTRKRFASHVRTLSVVDDVVYVAQDRDTLHVVAGGRRALIEQGKTHLQGWAEEIVVRDKFAYVAAGPSGLLIFDVGDTNRPRQVGHFPIYTDFDSRLPMASGVDVLGELVFLVTSLGLHIIDVSDPASPDEVNFISDVAAYDVEVRGDYAYVAGRVFRVYSLSDPETPVELGKVDLGSYTHGMEVQDNFAYVASSTGLIVLDVSDPANPNPVAHYATTDIAFDVSLSGTLAYVATEDGELHILDVSDARLPVKVGGIVVDDAIEEVAIGDGVAYAAAGRSGLLLLDISDPAHPRRISSYDTGHSAGRLAVADGVAFVADRRVHLIDVGDPGAPKAVGFIETGGYSVSGIVVRGGIAYIAGVGGLRAYDVRNAAAPSLLGSITHCEAWQSCARSLAIEGDTAYLIDVTRGLRMVDVGDPEHLVEVGFFEMPVLSGEVAVAGGIAYITASSELYIVDVADPARPVLRSVLNLGVQDATNVTVEGSTAYVLDWQMGLTRVDVSDPSVPRIIDRFSTEGATRNVVVDGDLIFVAAESNGLFILREEKTGSGAEKPSSRPSFEVHVFPNPFARDVHVEFELADAAHVRLVIYDMLGRKVSVLTNEWRSRGLFSATWDARSMAHGTAPGVYILRIEAGTLSRVIPLARMHQ